MTSSISYPFVLRPGLCRFLAPLLRFLAPLLLVVAPCFGLTAFATPPPQAGTTAGSATPGSTSPGTPFTADRLNKLLPPSVYFQGRTAMLQLRNAGGTAFAGNTILWAALVDTSGYASDVQERYQFYLVTEGPLQIGTASLPAGIYGAGFIGERFLVMDVGGHSVAEGTTQMDGGLQRPRPLQVLPESPTSVRLYLGRRWVTLKSGVAGAS